jgi:glucose-6-phosphate-specific signal transduction histidine kinase
VTATSPAVAACVYFVCSEALANVAKHASASAAQISVTRQAGTVTVEVADDGAGGADRRGRGIRGRPGCRPGVGVSAGRRNRPGWPGRGRAGLPSSAPGSGG